MIIKKLKKKRLELLKIELIKSKTYTQKTNVSHKSIINELKLIEICLKRVLKIIYGFHINNQKICFVGVPEVNKKMFNTVISNTKHLMIPENTWINGILSNKTSIFKYLNNKLFLDNSTEFLFQIKQKPKLIVVFNSKLEMNVLIEAKKLKIPTIVLNSNSFLNEYFLYDLPLNIEHMKNKLFFVLLYSILKR